MSKNKIKPSANIIRTLGKDLIKDSNAALIELVKNAYDADSTEVKIEFIFNNDYSYTIIIDDYGHGMNEDDIINKWLVPSFSSKKDSKYSPKGRAYLGSKGIGRFSAQILGRYFTMITKQEGVNAKKIELDWTIFDKVEFLQDIDVEIDDIKFDRNHGTKLIIQTESLTSPDDLRNPKFNFDNIDPWNLKNTKKIVDEFRMILTPVKLLQGIDKNFKDDIFDIKFLFTNKITIQNYIETCLNLDKKTGFYVITPYDIFNLFDYQIKGYIRADGYILGEFTSRHSNEVKMVERYTKYTDFHNFGEAYFDIRIIDRDNESIEQKQAIFYKNDDLIGKRDLKNLYNQVNGINIFRNNFALKPYSEGYDWLDLDKRRVQKTTLLGHNQTMGYVYIQDEENSNLIEKSARDGLKETLEYYSLVELMQEIIDEAANLRMVIRHSLSGESKSPSQIIKNVEETLNELDQLKQDITHNFSTKDNQENVKKAIDQINKAQQNVKQKMITLDDVLSQYEKHITLGKMIDIIIHEIRRSLQWFSDIPTKLKIVLRLIDNEAYLDAQNSINRYNNTTNAQLQLLNQFMKTLDPLSRSRKRKPSFIYINPIIENISTLFQTELETSKIVLSSNVSDDFKLFFDSSDLMLILTNLIENSIYWLNSTDQSNKTINISSYIEDEYRMGLLIYDNGPGIDKNINHNDIIFEPGFSTKANIEQKTGLGLSIAGEAASRNHYKLRSRKQKHGCLFSLDKEIVNENN